MGDFSDALLDSGVPNWVLVLLVIFVVIKGGDVVFAFVSKVLSRWQTDAEKAEEDSIVVTTLISSLEFLQRELSDLRTRVGQLEASRSKMLEQSRVHSIWDEQAYLEIVKYNPEFPRPPVLFLEESI